MMESGTSVFSFGLFAYCHTNLLNVMVIPVVGVISVASQALMAQRRPRGRGRGASGRGTLREENVPGSTCLFADCSTAELNFNSSALTRMRGVIQDLFKYYGQGIKTMKPLGIGETVSGGTLSGTQALLN